MAQQEHKDKSSPRRSMVDRLGAARVMYDGIPFVSANQSGDYRIQAVPVEALQEFSLVQNNILRNTAALLAAT